MTVPICVNGVVRVISKLLLTDVKNANANMAPSNIPSRFTIPASKGERTTYPHKTFAMQVAMRLATYMARKYFTLFNKPILITIQRPRIDQYMSGVLGSIEFQPCDLSKLNSAAFSQR